MRIQLCGSYVVKHDGSRMEDRLPGHQGRLLLAYLAVHRLRPVTREELVDAVWPVGPPPAVRVALRSILSKLRSTLGSEAIVGRETVRLVLPADSYLDIEAADEAIHRAESAVALEEWARAWGPSRVALNISRRPFMHGHETPWIDDQRAYMEELELRALECVAAIGLGLGGPELAATERAAGALIERSRYRESGYRWLMEAALRRGNRAEALVVYDQLCELLRDELGVEPSPATIDLHERLLQSSGRNG